MFEIIVFGVRLFPVYPSPNIKLLVGGDNLLITMATSTWTLPINHGIMDRLSCHVYEGIHYHHNQNDP